MKPVTFAMIIVALLSPVTSAYATPITGTVTLTLDQDSLTLTEGGASANITFSLNNGTTDTIGIDNGTLDSTLFDFGDITDAFTTSGVSGTCANANGFGFGSLASGASCTLGTITFTPVSAAGDVDMDFALWRALFVSVYHVETGGLPTPVTLDVFASIRVNDAASASPTVPEPATLTLTALGLAGIVRRSRRRRGASR